VIAEDLQALVGTDDAIRPRAAMALEPFTTRPLVRRALLRALGDSREQVRFAAAHTLRRAVPQKKVFDALMSRADDSAETFEVRGVSIESIGQLAQAMPVRARLRKRAERFLLEMLEHPDVELRYWTSWALALIGSRASLAALRLLLSDERVYRGWWSVGEEAQDAIDGILGRPVPDRVPLTQRLREAGA
jgi:hypothetical protein